MNDYAQQAAMNRAEDKYLSAPEYEDPKILCDECSEDITGETRYEICGNVFCADCIDNMKVEGN